MTKVAKDSIRLIEEEQKNFFLKFSVSNRLLLFSLRGKQVDCVRLYVVFYIMLREFRHSHKIINFFHQQRLMNEKHEKLFKFHLSNGNSKEFRIFSSPFLFFWRHSLPSWGCWIFFQKRIRCLTEFFFYKNFWEVYSLFMNEFHVYSFPKMLQNMAFAVSRKMHLSAQSSHQMCLGGCSQETSKVDIESKI